MKAVDVKVETTEGDIEVPKKKRTKRKQAPQAEAAEASITLQIKQEEAVVQVILKHTILLKSSILPARSGGTSHLS